MAVTPSTEPRQHISESWRNRTVLVTGATGLLGPWLCQHLVGVGAHVVALVRDQMPRSNFFRLRLDRVTTIVRGDVCDLPLLQRTLNEYEVDSVFHLAAQAVIGAALRSPLGSFETNIRGTWCVLEAARLSRLIRAVVVASSDKAYGSQACLPYTEQSPLAATRPYDVSKACADQLARSYFETYGLPVAVTRCGNLFGGGDLNFSRLIPGTIRSIWLNEAPVIRSDGQFVRDYVYVEDAARAYMQVAEALHRRPEISGEAFNFSLERPATVLGITNAILSAMGSNRQPIIRNEATHEIREQYLSAAKARQVLGWAPLYSTEDGLNRAIAWYREYLSEQFAG